MRRPNVLFLLADDQQFDTIRALGNPAIHTPNLDRLVARGTAFRNAYIVGGNVPAVCCPSRAMIHTGRPFFRIADVRDIGATLETMPETFRLAGYRTFATGKQHNGPTAVARGFDEAEALLFAGIDWDRVFAYRKEHGNEQGSGIVRKGIADGMFIQPDLFLVGMSRIGKTTGYLNGGHLFNLDALRCRDLTGNAMLGRRIAQDYLAFYRKYIPGCEAMEQVTTASVLGIRESRRIKGEYVLSLEDYLARRQFPDQIGVFAKFVDIHPYDTSEEQYERFKNRCETHRLGQGECFGLPYGILVPRGWRNLWVAGRCASSDVPVQGAIRVQPSCSMMGQAAGTAAVQSARTGQPACDLDTKMLVETLRAASAYLPQTELREKMSRSRADKEVK